MKNRAVWTLFFILAVFIGLTGQTLPHVSDALTRVRQLTFWSGSGDRFGIHTESTNGGLWYFKNNTDNAYGLLMGGDNTVYMGTSGGSDSQVPSIHLRTDGTGDNEIRLPTSSVGQSEIDKAQRFAWTGVHSNWGTSNFGETSTNERFGLDAMTKVGNGIGNTAIGYSALKNLIEGSYNTGIGGYSLENLSDGLYNVGLGLQTLDQNISGQLNLAIGFQNLYNSTNSGNISIASQGLFNLTTGASNIGIGYLPGYGLTSGIALITGTGNILIGQSTDVTATDTSYGIALGWAARCASQQFSIGPLINNLTLWGQTDSADRERGEIDVAWIDSSDATRKARVTLSAYDTAEREAIRIDADGSRALVGIGGQTPTARFHLPAGSATANTAPIKFTSGTNLTTAEAGAVEYDGTELYFSPSTTRYKLGQVTAGSSTIASGTYTPTRSSETNLDANVTMTQAQYMRVGNTVTVSGRFTANPTTTLVQTDFEITLPVASNIGATEDAAGTAACGTITTRSESAEVIGVAANDTAQIQWVPVDVANQTWSFQFSYEII